MGVFADEQGTGDALARPIFADGLGRRRDVCLVERSVGARASVAGGPECDALVGIGRVGVDAVVGGDERRDVDEIFRKGEQSSARVWHSPMVGPIPRRSAK